MPVTTFTPSGAGDVQRYSFGTDGRLQGSATSLVGADLLQEEAVTRLISLATTPLAPRFVNV